MKMNKNTGRKREDDAVSPVVGIMLMLVVTIIIAAVVAVFASGVTSDEQVAPNVKFDVSYKAQISDSDKTNSVPDYPVTNKPVNNGFTFRLMSGDTVELQNIKVMLSVKGNSITLGPETIQTTESSISAINAELLNIRSADSATPDTTRTYFAVPLGMDYVITPGESFTLLADGYYDSSANPSNPGRYLLWHPKDGGTFTVRANIPVTYTIFDTISGKQIQTGSVTIF